MTIGVSTILDLVKKAKSDADLLNAIKAEVVKLSDTPEDNAALEAALSAKANGGNTAFRLLVENEFSETIEYLAGLAHTKGFLIKVLSIQDASGLTPINAAIADEKNEVAKALTQNILSDKAGLDVVLSIGDDFGATPLYTIIENDNAELFEHFASQAKEMILTRIEGDNKQQPAHIAAAGDKAEIIKSIGKIASGNAELLKSAFAADKGGNNPLHWAVEGNKVNAVKALIEVAKNAGLFKELLEGQNTSQETALNAVLSDNAKAEIAKVMLEAVLADYVNLNGILKIENEYGDTPLSQLTDSSNSEINGFVQKFEEAAKPKVEEPKVEGSKPEDTKVEDPKSEETKVDGTTTGGSPTGTTGTPSTTKSPTGTTETPVDTTGTVANNSITNFFSGLYNYLPSLSGFFSSSTPKVNNSTPSISPSPTPGSTRIDNGFGDNKSYPNSTIVIDPNFGFGGKFGFTPKFNEISTDEVKSSVIPNVQSAILGKFETDKNTKLHDNVVAKQQAVDIHVPIVQVVATAATEVGKHLAGYQGRLDHIVENFQSVTGRGTLNGIKNSIINHLQSQLTGVNGNVRDAIAHASKANHLQKNQKAQLELQALGQELGLIEQDLGVKVQRANAPSKQIAAQNQKPVNDLKIAKLKEATFKVAQVVEKLPQAGDDLNYFSKKLVGYDLGAMTGLEGYGSYVKFGAGATMTFVSLLSSANKGDYLNSLYPVAIAAMGTETASSYVDNIYVKGGIALATTGLAYASGVGPIITAATFAVQAVDMGLDYAVDNSYIAKDGRVVSYVKPISTVTSGAANIAYSPSLPLKIIGALHLGREMGEEGPKLVSQLASDVPSMVSTGYSYAASLASTGYSYASSIASTGYSYIPSVSGTAAVSLSSTPHKSVNTSNVVRENIESAVLASSKTVVVTATKTAEDVAVTAARGAVNMGFTPITQHVVIGHNIANYQGQLTGLVNGFQNLVDGADILTVRGLIANELQSQLTAANTNFVDGINGLINVKYNGQVAIVGDLQQLLTAINGGGVVANQIPLDVQQAQVNEQLRVNQLEDQRIDGLNQKRDKAINSAKFKESVFKAAQVAYKLPQLADDVTHVVKQATGFDAAQYTTVPLNAKVESVTGVKDASSCIAQVIENTSTGLMAITSALSATTAIGAVGSGLYPIAREVLKIPGVFSYYLGKPLAGLLKPYVGEHAEYYINTGSQLVGTTALSLAFGGPVLAGATLFFQGANLGLDYGTQHGYISAENPVINYGLKPGLTVGSQIMSIVYSPNKIVKAFEIVHLVREGFDHTQAYLDSFKFTDDQFPVLKGLGISATDLMAAIQTTATDNDLVRESYNAKITKIFNDHFAAKAREAHCKGEAISSELAKDASGVRNELKYLHHLQTSLVGRIAIDVYYKLYKYGTTTNPDYASFHAQGKSDEDIFYASFKTDGGKLGLKNNGFAEAITLAAQLSEAKVAGVKEIYPEHIKDGAAECFAKNSNDIKNAFETTCKEYFDFTCPTTAHAA